MNVSGGSVYEQFAYDYGLELPVGYQTNQIITAMKKKKVRDTQRVDNTSYDVEGNEIPAGKYYVIFPGETKKYTVEQYYKRMGYVAPQVVNHYTDVKGTITKDSSVYDIVEILGNAQSIEELDRLYNDFSVSKNESKTKSLTVIGSVYWVVFYSCLTSLMYIPIAVFFMKRASLLYFFGLAVMVCLLIVLRIVKDRQK